MPITPHFTIQQTLSHVELDIRVPHVRVTPESIQVALSSSSGNGDNGQNSILHFASPPYLLILNVAALHDITDTDTEIEEEGVYCFHETANEACATYEPTIENGMIHLSLKKAVPKLWNNLHLLGRMVMSRSGSKPITARSNNNSKNPTSQWLLEEVASTTTTLSSVISKATDNDMKDYDLTTNAREVEVDVEEGQERIPKLWRPRPGYGFAGMFDGVFSDLTRDGLAKEMLECPPDGDENNDDPLLVMVDDDMNDAKSDSFSDTIRRRNQRRLMENSKFDPDRYRQDLIVEDDYIYQCAMAMKPHWIQLQQEPLQEGGTDLQAVTKQLDSLSVHAEKEEAVGKHNTVSNAPQQQQESSYFTEEERLQLVSIPYPLLSPETSLMTSSRRLEQSRNDKHDDDSDIDDHDDKKDLTLGILVGLIDLLFAHVYDHLTTDGDATVESAWSISILSASLSWMEDWRHLSSFSSSSTRITTTTSTTPATTREGAQPASNSSNRIDDDLEAAVQEVLYSSLRRALIYPYLRSLTFALHCALQVADIVQQGPCCILRCLLRTRQVLNHSELYYLGNKLFIDPYLAWIQHQHSNLLSNRLAQMAQTIRQLVSAFDSDASMEGCKQALGFDLIRIEQEEEEDDDKVEDRQRDDEHSSSSSDSDGADADDDSSSNADTQSDDKDNNNQSSPPSTCQVAPLPESGRKEQPQSEKVTAISSELLDCSLGFSALHIVKPHDNVADGALTYSPTAITTENPTEPSTTNKCAEQQEQFDASSLSSSTPKKLVVALDD